MKILGLSGRARSGKDTICRLIQEDYPSAIRFAFADELKRQCHSAWNSVYPTVPFHELEKEIRRPLYQIWGTELCRRVFGADHWLKYFPSVGTDDFVIVTDVRYANEAKFIRDKGGLVFEVRRPSAESPWWTRVGQRQHCSEIQRFPVDGEIVNRGTIEDLREPAWNAVRLVEANQVAEVKLI